MSGPGRRDPDGDGDITATFRGSPEPRPGTAPTPPRRAVLALFLATVLMLPVGLAVARAWSEPYPAVFQPAFRGSPERDGTVDVTFPVAAVHLSSGERREIDYRQLVPDGEASPSTLLRTAYGSTERADDPRTRAWLTARMDALFPDNPVEQVEVTWPVVTFEIATQHRLAERAERTVLIDLWESS